jgi:hypothetical protein
LSIVRSSWLISSCKSIDISRFHVQGPAMAWRCTLGIYVKDKISLSKKLIARLEYICRWIQPQQIGKVQMKSAARLWCRCDNFPAMHIWRRSPWTWSVPLSECRCY